MKLGVRETRALARITGTFQGEIDAIGLELTPRWKRSIFAGTSLFVMSEIPSTSPVHICSSRHSRC